MNSEAKVKKVKPQSAPAKKRHKSASLDKKKAHAGWFFVLPFVLVFLLVYVPILLNSLQYSVHEMVKVTGGYDLDFVGLDNYHQALFVDAGFTEALVTGVQNLILQIPAIVIFALFMAVLLNQKMAGRTIFRAIFFIPVIISTGIMESIANSDAFGSYSSSGVDLDTSGLGSSGTNSGANQAAEIISENDLSWIFMNMKVGQELVGYVVGLVNGIYDIVNKAGVQMLIFLSGLQGISPAIYESCKVDGATAWETFWKITFPMISPMILVNVVYTIIDAFTAQGNSVMNYISNVSADVSKTNADVISQAMYWIYFLFVIIITVAFAGICSAFVFYQRRD